MASAQQRDTPLAQILKSRIAQDGPMPVSAYMSECLWDSHHGYYATKETIGRSGDFITASEVSQTFGELIGIWAAVVWQQTLGGPERVTFAEYGPGRGVLMSDALRAARVVPGFLAATHVHMIEMSPLLEVQQRAAMSAAGVPATWGQNLTAFPAPAIVIANEFLDAWPVTQWIKTSAGWRLRGVGLDASGDLAFKIMDDGSRNEDLDREFGSAPAGSVYECPDLTRFAGALAAISRNGPMAALVIDYGYTTHAGGDTLQALRNHAPEHPLCSPGEADLSAHVNFHALAGALHRAGLAIDGPVSQAEFLGALGIIERASRLMAANPARAGEIETGIARLMAPTGMGSLFKVIAVRRADMPSLPGFAVAAA